MSRLGRVNLIHSQFDVGIAGLAPSAILADD